MSLKDWEEKAKWLVAHTTTKEEIQNLLEVGERDLRDSEVAGLSDDARLSHAYAAALQYASAALSAAGYRPARGGDHHFRVIQALSLTIGWDAKRVAKLDAFRKKRNLSSYERAGEVSNAESSEMHELAVQLRKDVMAWLKKNYAELT